MDQAAAMKKLKNGNGIRALLDEGYKILRNPIILFDTDYRLIAFTDLPFDDPLWVELTTTGTFGEQSQRFFMEASFTDAVANAKKLAIMKSPSLSRDRVQGHIYNGDGIKVANLLMVEDQDRLSPSNLAALAVLTDLVTKEIRHDAAYIAYGEAYQDTWLNKLIQNDFGERAQYSPHVQILYDNLKANLYLAVATIPGDVTGERDAKYYVNLFRRERRDFKYAVHDGRAVLLVSTNHRRFLPERELAGVLPHLERDGLLVGVSSRFDNLFDLHRYYGEAAHALTRAGTENRVALYTAEPPTAP